MAAGPGIDRIRAQAIQALYVLRRTAAEVGMPFCLMDGTLLGAWRDGDFCQGDADDLDIGILDADFPKVETLVRQMASVGFESYKSLEFHSQVAGLGLQRGDIHIDLQRILNHPAKPECYVIGRLRTLVKRHEDADYSPGNTLLAFVYPSRHLTSFGQVTFFGMDFHVPVETDGYLAVRYGQDWRTPLPREGYDWYRQAGPGVIRHDYDLFDVFA
jgi:hypothetical protein